MTPYSNEPNSAQEKALHINRDAQVLGTFAEIGAGQEVARWFFQAGKASATLAKSISAYDMAVSDSLYGPTEHYVSRGRLESMLDLEYTEAVARLGAKHGETTRLFAFADTVATHTSRRSQAGHGWMGVRFQTEPGAEPSEVIIHIEMLDILTVSQQEAVGLVGVNLLFAAFYLSADPGASIRTLLDGLDRHRLEIDMIRFSGPGFDGVDNRLMSLQLVESGLTDAVMFTERGDVVQPAEVLSGKAVLIERGSFRPLTNVTREMLDRAREQLQTDFPPGDRVILMEMTLNNLMSEGKIDHADFLARVGMLGVLGYMVMISNYTRFDLVMPYLRAYTREHIGMVAGIPTLLQILDAKYYEELPGGLLEGLAGLFRGPVKLLVYPTKQPGTGEIVTADTVAVAPNLKHLYAHLRENRFIEPIRTFDTRFLNITPADVLAKIQSGDPSWETAVPPEVFQAIVRGKLFGYRAAGEGPS